MRYYLHVLDYSKKAYVCIRLTEEESKKYQMYEDINDFIKYEKIGEKYDFDSKNSHVMIADRLTIFYK